MSQHFVIFQTKIDELRWIWLLYFQIVRINDRHLCTPSLYHQFCTKNYEIIIFTLISIKLLT